MSTNNKSSMKTKLIAALAAATLGSPALAETYDLDAAHTTLGFAVKHLVVSTVHGNFSDFKGEFSYDAAKPEAFTATATVKTRSVSSGVEKRDAHLKGPDFFDADKYPEIKFEATGAEKSGDGVMLKGRLTIKDTTKEVAIPLAVNGPIQDPWGMTRVGIEGSFKINRKDYGLNFDAKLANGGLVVADEVKIEISAEGIRRK